MSTYGVDWKALVSIVVVDKDSRGKSLGLMWRDECVHDR